MDKIYFGLTIYSSCLVVYGTISNALTVFVCFFTSLNKHPTFIFLGTNAILHTIVLLILELSSVYEYFSGNLFFYATIEGSKAKFFLSIICMISISWLTVIYIFKFLYYSLPLLCIYFVSM